VLPPESWEPSLECRTLDADDTGALTALFERCHGYFELVQDVPAGDEEVDDFLTDCPQGRTEEDLVCFGVFSGDDLLGVASTFRDFPTPGCWWVGLFLVDPDRRREGFGRAFFEALTAWFGSQGASSVQLGVLEPNHGGRLFWERLGFEFVRVGRPVTEGVAQPVPTDVLGLRL
jgi:GNAT superfamily N-acetyltransferase